MEHTILTANIILAMREYQKENNVMKQCVSNAQYLYDIINMNTKNNVKTKAVIVYSADYEKSISICVSGHIVLVIDDETQIDPSYDVFCLKDKMYFNSIHDFFSAMDDENKRNFKARMDIKKIIKDHLYFSEISERINNGNFIITEKEHYNKQADYIENIFN